MAQIIVRMPEKLLDSLNEKARLLGIARNALILQILWRATEDEKGA